MILGAQLYSLRHKTQTEPDFEETFRRVAEMGYHAVQLSAIGPIPAEKIAALSEKYSLPVTCTHSSFERIINDTDKLIEEHKTYGCSEIGLGCFPWKYYPHTREGVVSFLHAMQTPAKKIRDAGLTFAYHNHNFEFADIGGTTMFDLLIENSDFNFIPDVYWLSYSDVDPSAMLRRLSGRVINVHLKDMTKDEKREICACGNGQIDFDPIIRACEETGVKYALVEEDNAPEKPDAFAEMEASCRFLTPKIYR